MKNPFIKFVVKEKKQDIFHSSGYGKAQSGEVIGTASSMGFDERVKIERNRQIVRGYNDSKIARQGISFGSRAKKYTPKESSDGGSETNSHKVPIIAGANNSEKKSFRPPSFKPNFGK